MSLLNLGVRKSEIRRTPSRTSPVFNNQKVKKRKSLRYKINGSGTSVMDVWDVGPSCLELSVLKNESLIISNFILLSHNTFTKVHT